MAIVNFSLDTKTRQSVLTIDGVMVSSTDVVLEKYIYDGETHVRFSYTIESVNGDGMREKRQFYLPSLEEIAVEAHAGINKDGFAFKILYDDEKAKADVINFLKRSHSSG